MYCELYQIEFGNKEGTCQVSNVDCCHCTQFGDVGPSPFEPDGGLEHDFDPDDMS